MDKDEITKMPEGMSSEELDALTTGEEEPEAQEALEATEKDSPPAEESVKDEPTEKEEPEEKEEKEEKPVAEEPEELSETDKQLVAKDAKIGEFRRKNRDLEITTARLEGELKARKSIQTEEKPKSPLEIAEAAYIETYGSLPADGLPMTGEIYRQQRDFDNTQAETKTATVEHEKKKVTMDRAVKSLQADELSVEKMGDGLDFNSIINLGQDYLDKADLLKIEIISNRDGVETGVRKAYDLCKGAIFAANNADSKLLQSAISNSQTKPKKEPEVPKKPTDIDALTIEDAEKGEAEISTHNSELANFVCN